MKIKTNLKAGGATTDGSRFGSGELKGGGGH